MVRGLVITPVIIDPTIFMIDNAVCGTSCPNIDVLPTNGANSSQILAHTIEEYPHIRFFSGDTNSVVHVVNMERVDEIVILATIDVTMSRKIRSDPVTINYMRRVIFHSMH